jgi:pSer/pThr/pTyr-binding forkhead associated (FHA) protein/type II secretory pathway pseudopilin PulG
MRFDVRYPTGAQHEVELSGTLAVMGRDPSSDLVLNDPKCSRRHAVIEAGPDGMAIRDAGSANGIYVNGKKVERAKLSDGDEIRLGDVVVRVLPEDVPGTLVMAPEDLDEVGATRPPRPAAKTTPSAPPPPPPQPPKASVAPAPPPRPPARPAPPVRRADQIPTQAAVPKGGKNNTLLIVGALGCLALLMLTVLAVLAAIFLPSYLRARTRTTDTSAACAARLRAVSAAEDAFRSGTCGAYADMEGLTNPGSTIPNYPAGAPGFLSADFAAPVADGCRFELTVADPVTPAAGCPTRSFRRYTCAASPVSGQGRFLLLESGGTIHVAESRAATPEDPLLKP